MEQEQQVSEEPTQEDISSMRAEIAAEVWGTEPPEKETPQATDERTEESHKEVEPEQAAEAKQPDDIATIKAEINKVLSSLKTHEYRLKQTESRVGSVINELSAAKQAAKRTDDGPSQQQIQDAAKSKESWSELKKEFPEWSAMFDGIDARLSTVKAPDQSEIDRRVDQQVKQILKAHKVESEKVAQRFAEETRLDIKHPDWRDLVKSDDYNNFIKSAPVEIKNLHNHSPYAKDAMVVLDAFMASQKKESVVGKKTASEINSERKDKLKTAQVSPGRGATPPKPGASLSREELWRQVSKEVW